MGNSARSLKTKFITILASVTVRHLYSYCIKKMLYRTSYTKIISQYSLIIIPFLNRVNSI